MGLVDRLFRLNGSSFYLFLTWLPRYLTLQLHLGLIKSGSYATVPWLVAAIEPIPEPA